MSYLSILSHQHHIDAFKEQAGAACEYLAARVLNRTPLDFADLCEGYGISHITACVYSMIMIQQEIERLTKLKQGVEE